MALYEEWAENPPSHWILRAVHIKPDNKIKGDPADLLNMQENGLTP
jgi:hypothetical protein